MPIDPHPSRRDVVGGGLALSLAGPAGADVAAGLPAWRPARALAAPRGGYLLPDGRIRIVGTAIMRTLIEGLNRRFAAAHPGFGFSLDMRPGLMAIGPAAYGVTPFAPMPRLFTRVELDAFRAIAGRDPVVVRAAHGSVVARDRTAVLAIYVHRSNPIAKLTLDQIGAVFGDGAGAGAATTWGQLGLGGDWSERPIHPIGTPFDTGFGSYLADVLGRPLSPRLTYRAISTQVMDLVGADTGAIAYCAINFATPLARQVAVARREPEPGMMGTAAEVTADRYPLDRFVYLYALPDRQGKLEPWIEDYLRLLLSREGQAIVAGDRDSFLPLGAERAAGGRTRLTPAG